MHEWSAGFGKTCHNCSPARSISPKRSAQNSIMPNSWILRKTKTKSENGDLLLKALIHDFGQNWCLEAALWPKFTCHMSYMQQVASFRRCTRIQSREALVSAKVFGKGILSFGILKLLLRRSISFSTLLAMLGYLAQLTSPPALLLKRQHHQRLILQSSFLYTRYIQRSISDIQPS